MDTLMSASAALDVKGRLEIQGSEKRLPLTALIEGDGEGAALLKQQRATASHHLLGRPVRQISGLSQKRKILIGYLGTMWGSLTIGILFLASGIYKAASSDLASSSTILFIIGGVFLLIALLSFLIFLKIRNS